MAASPATNSMIAMWAALMASRSRMEGRTPPYPPMTSPFAAKSSATATTDFVLARRAVRSGAVAAEVMTRSWVRKGLASAGYVRLYTD